MQESHVSLPGVPAEAPEDVVALALAIVEEETRSWSQLRQRVQAQSPEPAEALPRSDR
jgi:hypothetical protein